MTSLIASDPISHAGKATATSSMNQELSNKPATPRRRGMRLWRVEVLNWGTLGDNVIHATDINGGWLCITGRNGTGKSTLADAIITAFPPAHSRILYNAAGGAKNTKERTRITYLKGHFGGEQDSSGRSQPTSLRTKPGTLTAILQQYHEEGTDRWVTSLILGTFNAGNEDIWLYGIIEQKLTLEVVKGTEDWETRAKRLRRSGWSISADPGAYRDKLRANLNIPTEKAIQTFVRTVGLKDIGDVNSFIRGNMLDDVSTHERYVELTKHYEKQIEIDREIAITKAMVEMLRPLAKHIPEYRRLNEQLAKKNEINKAVEWKVKHDTADSYAVYIADLEKKLTELDGLLTAAEGDATRARNLLVTLNSSEPALRARDLTKRAEDVASRRRSIESTLNQLRAILSSIKGVRAPSSPVEFAAMTEQLQKLVDQTDATSEERGRAVFEAGLRASELEAKRKNLLIEVEQFKLTNSHLPVGELRARQEIADALDLKPSDLPYAGELLDVFEKESEWRIGIEKLLRTFARRMLVPQEHASRVLAYVKSNTFDRHRVRIEVVPAKVARFTLGSPHPHAACLKVRIKPNTPFSDWLSNTLATNFDHVCCRKLSDYEQNRGKAITPEGLIKGNSGNYHEKRDDIEIRGARDYFLGWDNAQKVIELNRDAAELERLQIEALAAAKRARASDDAEKIRRDQARTVLDSVKTFQSIDIASANHDTAEIERERVLLKKNDPDAADMDRQISEANTALENAEKAIKTLTERRGGVLSEKDNTGKLIAVIEEWEGENEKPTDELLNIAAQFFKTPAPTVPNALPAWGRQVEKSCESHFGKIGETSNNLGLAIKGIMSGYLATYPAERKNLTDDVSASLAFLERLRELEVDRLHELQERFREHLKENLALHVSTLKSSLQSEVGKSRKRIEEINKILLSIPWEQNRIIQILPRNNPSIEIRTFEELMKQASAPLLDPSETEKVDSFEAVKQLIKFLENENNRRMVLDPRNWSLFAVEWRDLSIEDVNSQRVDFKEDTAGLSGGQKAKLSVTLLASALAFQYDIAGANASPNTFRTVLIDEAFSKLDSDNARYALELFKQFDFQLLLIHPLDGTVRVAEEYVEKVLLATIRDNKHSMLTPVSIAAISNIIDEEVIARGATT